ncbi:MAG: transporter substrate-binding domain-containing protein [Clostridiales bacterium]|nr:transporter substrate-binding domain-containing protein [Clostridiales bacterium]
MKKFLSAFLAVVMMLSVIVAFAGCSKEDTVDDTSADTADSVSAEDSDLAYIQEKGTLVIGITLFAPMDYYADEDETELTGFEVEFGKAVCEKLGVTPEFQVISWDAKESELNAKNIDCIWNGLTITEERQETMSISTPYMANKQVLVVKSENADKYTTAEALTGLSVVAEKESAGEEVATTDEFFANAEYTAVESMARAMMEVKSGTADAAVIDYVTGIGSLGEGTDYEDLVMVEGAEFADEEYGIAFRKDSDVTAEVNKIIEELGEDGTLLEIAEKYKLQDQLLVK